MDSDSLMPSCLDSLQAERPGVNGQEKYFLSVFVTRTWALIGDENALPLIFPAKMVNKQL
jgi:hypothetical protein